MADDPKKRGEQDRARVAGKQDYEVAHFARKHGLTPEQVQLLIEKHGNDRAALEAAAKRLSKTK